MVHVSSAEAMEQIRWARERGLKIYAETCPQYLFLTEEDFRRPEWEGAKFICSPPTRPGSGWRCERVFDIVSSDQVGQPHFAQVAPGVPGIEVRLPLLFDELVSNGRLGINRFVALTSTNAAKIYGPYPRKGPIAIGSDAYFALWDADRPRDDPP